MFTRNYIVGDVTIDETKTLFTENPLLIPILCSAFSLWIIGLFTLKKLKNILKL